jgi:hypothetical protein
LPDWLALVVVVQAGTPVAMAMSVSPAAMPLMLPERPVTCSPTVIDLLAAL